MRTATFVVPSAGGVEVQGVAWLPDAVVPRALVQIAHGMAEHVRRYARLAARLTAAGYSVYAHDHRGHGRTAGPETRGFFADRDGWRHVVDDVRAVGAHARAAHPGLPLVLFGHSMGSFFVQEILCTDGCALAGAVLSGSAAPLDAPALVDMARAERARLGGRGRSETLAALSFGAFNQPFQPARTPFDWLSRDPAEVDAYVADPYCGFPVTTQLWLDLLEAMPALGDPARLAAIPRDLPILVISGSDDPVGGPGLESLRRLLAAYAAAGLRRVRHRFYPGGRHELLNETNRDEVTDDLLVWLDGVIAPVS